MAGLEKTGLNIPEEMSDADAVTVARHVIQRLSELDRYSISKTKASETMAEHALKNPRLTLLSDAELKHALQSFEIPADVRRISIPEAEHMFAIATRFLDRKRPRPPREQS